MEVKETEEALRAFGSGMLMTGWGQVLGEWQNSGISAGSQQWISGKKRKSALLDNHIRISLMFYYCLMLHMIHTIEMKGRLSFVRSWYPTNVRTLMWTLDKTRASLSETIGAVIWNLVNSCMFCVDRSDARKLL